MQHDHEPTIDVIRELGVADVGASHNQRLALLVIASAEEPIPMGHVAERIGISRGAMTTIVDGLVDSKFVKRHHDLGDRRTIHLTATPLALRAIVKAEKTAGLETAEAVA